MLNELLTLQSVLRSLTLQELSNDPTQDGIYSLKHEH